MLSLLQRPLATLRRQSLLVFLVATLVPLAVFAAIGFTSISQALDRQGQGVLADHSNALLAVIDSTGRSATDQIVSFGEWTPFCQAIVGHKLDWIADNVTVTVPQTTALKGAEVLTLSGQVVAAGGEFRRFDLAGVPIVRSAAAQGRTAWDLQVVGGRLYLLAAGPVVSQDVRDKHRYGVVVFGQPVDGRLLAQYATYIGAQNLGLYEDRRLAAASAGALPARLSTAADGQPHNQGTETVLLAALRNRLGEPQGTVRLTMASATLSLTDAALWRAMLWALVVAIVMAVGIGFGLTNLVRRPLRRLAEAARGIAAGSRVERLEVRRRDEIGELAGAFNTMSEQVARQLRENAEAYSRLDEAYLETVTALAAAMEAKDHYTADHAASLASTSLAVGRRLGLDEEALRELNYAAILHDIGKIGVPGRILNKPGPLDAEEFALMTEHTVIGEQIIENMEHLRPVARIVRSAHERYDGKGYPDGLAGESIPFHSRILFVCDAYDAMTSDRPYRMALTADEALAELCACAGSQFDPVVVEAFAAELAGNSEAAALRDPQSVSSAARLGVEAGSATLGYQTIAAEKRPSRMPSNRQPAPQRVD
jgi:HD-GYP domain-containing protein (c-di-GMP phosphodiesterase class II)